MEVRSIDVGFGNTKFTQKTTPELVCSMFPSDAPVVLSTGMAETYGPKRKTKRIAINDVTYEIGYDVQFAQSGGGFGRQMNSNFPQSDIYRALTMAAIEYMDIQPSADSRLIDVLILGLPISAWKKQRQELSASFRGQNKYAVSEQDKITPRTVMLNSVKVLPQPYGGFVDAVSSSQRDVSRETTLIIDPGYFTLDWLLVEGQHINDARSDALENGGVGSYNGHIQKAIELEVGEVIGRGDKLERALAEGETTFKVSGKTVELNKHRAAAMNVINQSVSRMLERLGGLSDVDNIVVVGGAAQLYGDAMKRQMPPSMSVTIAKDPVFANVRGFQTLGEQWAKEKK